ncbi:type I methionyl aminopeptidase [Planctomycetota bacterium]
MTRVPSHAEMTLKSPSELSVMREAGRVVAECHALMREMARVGVRTRDIDREVESLIRARGGEPAFLGYHGFPASICASVNEEVVHGIPNRRRLRDGDILSVDVGVALSGYYGDAADTIPVGAVDADGQRLIGVSWEALRKAIESMRPEGKLSDVAVAIQTHAESNGYSVVRKFVGHGIGRSMHEAPQVPNYVSDGLLANDVTLKAGLVLAIEPMLNVGACEVKVKKNKWTVVTRDGKRSAHVEHTVAVTETGAEILTLP